MKKILILAMLTISGTVIANEEGKELHDEACIRCHDSEIYTRFESRIENHFDLKRQVSFCSSNLSTGWFPEEEEAVIDFLNSTYYKFKD
jgi:hypothetical protein